MTIVMGLDRDGTGSASGADHGGVDRYRDGRDLPGPVAPADRGAVRRFLERFAGQALEVALEATTGWRFVVEELRAVGARAHLAEPAETSALRGNKKHAKSDRADARHLRELLMCGRLPECWIAPDHILDLRAQVRLRHSLVDERGEWQQRIRAVLYHHGFPRRSDLDLLPAVCLGGSGGCVTVQHSSYAHLAGIPLPLFGLAGYTLLFISACLPGQRARTAGMVFTVFAIVASAGLAYLELNVIHAICYWCVASAVCATFHVKGGIYLSQVGSRQGLSLVGAVGERSGGDGRGRPGWGFMIRLR